MKSLKAQNNPFSNSKYELKFLQSSIPTGKEETAFSSKLKSADLYPLKPTQIEILQINLGKMCNQVCKHCHVDAGPDRKEIMDRDVMKQCLEVIKKQDIQTIDLTGGAPEMNPNFRWFVEEIRKIKRDTHIIVRSNLTIILANPKYYDLPDFFKKHQLEVVSSLPYFNARKTDAQRGEGVFNKSIEALKMLNKVGYGLGNSGLELNLIYNPTGAFLPPDQSSLEEQFKKKLKQATGVDFNSLFTITNLPISRFLDYLVRSGNYEDYMDKLIQSFNPMAAQNVMCRNTISVGWDGYLYDCDFNQMLDLKVDSKNSRHIKEWEQNELSQRNIVVNQHCFGCTAGAGSSCGGSTI
ncbi:arsenosugar biosynthesis radical SAM protein ArsS [Echinicola jeungdonensis]|uniref:Arsenosugar biosynthesis radical SAM (Seleno)protein ArsS n=1 Tax=Echinicola jeungdonensis TaxID=709343 RepID=A0ABV5J775_9BACT|nr:arsenosugar biosynthesis radical SAM (seleno)protein ArsS [Echinicola jeungdonensis]MDN3669160.1 arsenosugar biosynthesis radical SAM protein ArsS [Echinicola jeungdonensis]